MTTPAMHVMQYCMHVMTFSPSALHPSPLSPCRCEKKDITRIAQWIDPHLLGTFVKAVMRVVSYIDIVREVLLGLGKYEAHNKLDNHLETLLGGLVTNESLYLSMANQ